MNEANRDAAAMNRQELRLRLLAHDIAALKAWEESPAGRAEMAFWDALAEEAWRDLNKSDPWCPDVEVRP